LKPEVPSPKKVTDSLPPAIALSEKEARRYEGLYAHLESGQFFKLSMKDGRLINSEFFRKEVPVTAISENRLLFIDGNGMTELNPVFNREGAVSEIRIMSKSGKPDIFVPVKPPLESPQQLSEYPGTYYSDELDADWKLTLKGNNLILQISESLEPSLTAAYADVFTAANGQINLSFTRDDKGKIAGFVFNSAVDERDVKGITFKRK